MLSIRCTHISFVWNRAVQIITVILAVMEHLVVLVIESEVQERGYPHVTGSNWTVNKDFTLL